MVTQEQIDAAEVEAEKAENALDAAEAHHERAGSEKSLQEAKAARFAAHGARDRLRLLRSRWAAERASEARRAEAEESFPAKRRQALTQQLSDARDEATHAIASLEKAAVEALAAVAAYGAAVREVSAELLGAGLRAGDGGEDGGTTGGAVHLANETWRPADPASLLGAVMQSAVAAHDQRHPLAHLRWGQLGGLAEKSARDALLKAAER